MNLSEWLAGHGVTHAAMESTGVCGKPVSGDLHLGSLVELMKVGKSKYNALRVAAYLCPSLARGELLAVCEGPPSSCRL